MWCIVPAAGRGTRLQGVSQGLPKPLLEVAGRPLVLGVLDRVSESARHVCVVVPPDDPRVEDVVRAGAGRPVDFVVQPERLGVGHAVLQARHRVRGASLVVMGDAYYSHSLAPFVERWRATGLDGAVLVEAPDGPASRVMGRVHVHDGRVAALAKTAPDPRFEWRVAGAFILPESVFGVLEGLEASDTTEIEIEAAVTRMLASGHTFAAIPLEGWRSNVNRPEDLELVEARVTAGAGAFSRPGSSTA